MWWPFWAVGPLRFRDELLRQGISVIESMTFLLKVFHSYKVYAGKSMVPWCSAAVSVVATYL